MKKLIALGLLVGVIAAFKFLPWYVSVGGVVAALMLGKLLVGKLFKGFFMGLFAAKGAVLKDATVRLHGISNAPEPKRDEWENLDEDEQEIERESFCYRYLDLTITPVGADGPGRRLSEEEADGLDDDDDDSNDGWGTFSMWDPTDLALVGPDVKPGQDIGDGDDELGEVYDVAIHENGQWLPLEDSKLMGAHRIRLHVGVPPGHDQFKIRYYFEILKNAGSEA